MTIVLVARVLTKGHARVPVVPSDTVALSFTIAKRKSQTYNPDSIFRIGSFSSGIAVSQPNFKTDYYEVLGIHEDASRSEIERQYKREAAKHHPDRGGSEERMKSLNEAYGVLRSESLRREYDQNRRKGNERAYEFVPNSSPPARDVGVFGRGLNALLCLVTGGFLLLLVRFQWIWFLWPLAILALFVIGFGVLMARGALIAANSALPSSNFLRRYYGVQEVAFWVVVCGVAYGFYWVMDQ